MNDVFEQLNPADAEAYLINLLTTITTRNLRDEALTQVTPDDFSSGYFGGIWEAALKLQADGEKITKRNLIKVAKSTGVDQVLQRIGSTVPVPADFPHAVAEVKRCGQLRRLVEATQRIQQRAFIAEDPSQALAWAFDEIAKLDTSGTDTADTKDYGALLAEFNDALTADQAEYKTIPTPWTEVNERIAGGLHGGRVYIVGGRPGDGKSIVGHQLAEHAASLGHPALVFSVEMGKLEVTGRMVANGATVDMGEISRRVLSDHSWIKFQEYRERAEGYPLSINDKAELSVNYIKAECRTQQRRTGLDVVVVDYLQLLKPERNLSREQQVAGISRALKQLSRELDTAVVVPAQLNRRAVDRSAPSLADLRESGGIEADADVVMLLARQYHSDGDQAGKPNGKVTVDIAKNRHGRTGDLVLPFRGHFSRIG